MNNRLKEYLLSCADEADRRIEEARKAREEKQAKCECKNLSRPVHQGMGYFSQWCLDCGKDHGYDDR